MMVNLHVIANAAIKVLHPNETVTVYHSVGESNTKGVITALYAAPVEYEAQIQTLGSSELQQAESVSRTKVDRKAYLNASESLPTGGLHRRAARTGDYMLRADGTWWLVTADLEEFEKAGWVCVGIVQQARTPTITYKTPTVESVEAVVNEADLADGEATVSGTFTVSTDGDGGTLVIGDTEFTLDSTDSAEADSVAIAADYGTLTITGITDGVVSYTYTLSEAQDHSDGDVIDTITVTLTNIYGVSTSGAIAVTIINLAAVADTASVTEMFSTSVSGNVLDNDTADDSVTLTWGTDSANYTLTATDTDDEYTVALDTETVGTLALGSDGAYAFTLSDDYDVPDDGIDALVIPYTLTDSGGNTVSSTLSIEILSYDTWTYTVSVTSDTSYQSAIPINLYGQSSDITLLVDWGDGETSTLTSADYASNSDPSASIHTYAVEGTYTVNIHSAQWSSLYIDYYGGALPGGNTITSHIECFRATLYSLDSVLPEVKGLYLRSNSGTLQAYTNTAINLFYDCTTLTSINAALFAKNTGITTFADCFYGCTSLVTLNENMFAYNTAVTVFYNTFYNCTALGDFTLHIGSSGVVSAYGFVNTKSGYTRIIYVPSGSTTYTTFKSASLGCSIIGE